MMLSMPLKVKKQNLLGLGIGLQVVLIVKRKRITELQFIIESVL